MGIFHYKEQVMDKKKAAAIAGVLLYLTEEKEATGRRKQRLHPQPGPSPWAMYGRKNIMRMRTMVHRRTR